MNKDEILQKRRDEFSLIGGESALHIQYPDEFEYYAMALELVDKDYKSVDFFGFPVMPEDLSMPNTFNTTTKKTLAGITNTINPTFNQFTFSLSGTFGRTFRKVIKKTTFLRNVSNTPDVDSGVSISSSNSTNLFSTDWKTGYASCKMLERILDKSVTLDKDNYPYFLVFYNLAFNQAMLVSVESLEFKASADSSRIWKWSLSLKALANFQNNFQRSTTSLEALSSRLNINKSMRETNEKNKLVIKETDFQKFKKQLSFVIRKY